MNWHKIFQIIFHEFWVRIRSRWFWISTIATPFIFFLIFYLPIYFAEKESERSLHIYFIASDTTFMQYLEPHPLWTYHSFPHSSLDSLKRYLMTHPNTVGVVLPEDLTKQSLIATIYTSVSLSMGEEMTLQKNLENSIKKSRLVALGVDLQVLEKASFHLDHQVVKLSEEGEKRTSTGAAAMVGYISGFLMYIFLVFYGNMLMQGVSQEKQNRVVELLLTTVRPIELMFGKIVGIGFVGLFQYFVLGILTLLSLFLFIPLLLPKEIVITTSSSTDMTNAMEMIESLQEILTPGFFFLFFAFFLFGYLLYASFYAMIGSVIERDSDASQFNFIILLPLLVSVFALTVLFSDPNAPFIVFLSHFPMTSPVIMPARFVITDLPWYEILLSLFLLGFSLYLGIWASSRVYRAAILLFGHKPSWKLIWRLLKG